MILVFSCVGPFGIFLGEILSCSEILTAVFFSISAGLKLTLGTFIYIAATEIIVEEFSLSKHKWSKLFIYIVGFVLMSVLKFYEDDD